MEELLYFKRINDLVYKYIIEFDKEKVESLISEIKENCGMVNCSVDKEHDYVESEKIYVKTLRDSSKNGECVFYVEYIYPYLVKLIKELCEHNAKCIEKIYNPNEDEYFDLLGEERINVLSVSPFTYYEKLQVLINIRLQDKINITQFDGLKDYFANKNSIIISNNNKTETRVRR